MNVSAFILAQTQPAPTGPAGPPGSTAMPTVFLAMMFAMVVFMILSSRSQKKREKRQRDDMYAGLTRNDRVVTIGGVLGTILSIKDDEVVLKVDESTNTKMTFIKSAIQRVLGDDQPAAK